MARFALGEWFMAERSARTLIRPHGEEARARDAAAMLLMFMARAVSNHEGGPCFETRPPRPEERSSSALPRVFDALRSLEGRRPLLRMRYGSRCGASVKDTIAFTLAEAAR